MKILQFEQPEEIEVPSILTHMSIMVNSGSFSVKSEIGLNETVRHFGNKEELIKYLQVTLK